MPKLVIAGYEPEQEDPVVLNLKRQSDGSVTLTGRLQSDTSGSAWNLIDVSAEGKIRRVSCVGIELGFELDSYHRVVLEQ